MAKFSLNPSVRDRAFKRVFRPQAIDISRLDAFLTTSLLMLALSIYAIWIFAGYGNIRFTEFISFSVNDGWCTVPNESIFAHCFGDYAVLSGWVGTDKLLWIAGNSESSPYPASGWLPVYFFHKVGLHFNDFTLGRNLYLFTLLSSLVTPAILIARKKNIFYKSAILVLLGLTAAPTLITLDRGNTIGLAIAPLSLAMYSLVNCHYRKFIFYIIVAALIKPQLALFFLLLLAVRRYRYFLITSIFFVFLSVMSFLPYPGSMNSNLKNWALTIISYTEYQKLSQIFPYNLSLDRSFLTILQAARYNISVDQLTIISTVAKATALIMFIIILIITIKKDSKYQIFNLSFLMIIFVSTFPGVTYGYYASLLLIPTFMILLDQHGVSDHVLDSKRNSFEISFRRKYISIWSIRLTLFFISILMAPIYLPLRYFPGMEKSLGLHDSNLNIFQIFWGPILIAIFFLTIGRIIVGGNIESTIQKDYTLANAEVLVNEATEKG